MLRSLPFSHAGRVSGAQIVWRARDTTARWGLPAVLAGGLVLRLALSSRPGLHPDEALYASWALRVAEGRDPALLGVLVDKPPLFLYQLAGLFRLAGHASTGTADLAGLVAAGRLAAVGATLVSLVLLWAVARQVHGQRAALLAVGLYAVSPLAARLSPTLLTDPWLVLWMLLGLWAGLNGRSWLTGLACGLAYATKQQAVLLIPLILAVYFFSMRLQTSQGDHRPLPSADSHSIWRLAGGFLLVFAIVLWWDSLRWQWVPSFWQSGATAYGGLAWARWSELPQRIGHWGELVGYLFGWPLLALLVVCSGIGLRLSRRSLGAFDRLLVAFVVVYLAVHLVTTMAVWDRYALPLVPLLALLFGHGLALLWDALDRPGRVEIPTSDLVKSNQRRWIAAFLAVVLGYTVWLAAFSPIPVGDARAYDGAAQVSEHVRQTQPPGTILYHHWFGWHYGFYLADAPVDLRYWESPPDLAAKAAADRSGRQLIAFPAGRDHLGVQQALVLTGLRLQPELTVLHKDGTLSVTLYRIVPAAVGAIGHDES